jgi:hypothetical protein
VRTVPSRVATTALPPSIAHSGSFVICLIERRPSGAASKATPSFAWGGFFHLIIFQITRETGSKFEIIRRTKDYHS